MSARRPRQFGETQLCRLLEAGGMLVSDGGLWAAYRRQDARSRIVGVAAAPTVERLLDAGRARPLDGAPDRLVAVRAAIVPVPRICETGRRQPRARPLMTQLLSHPQLLPGEAIRFGAAAGRFRADMQQAASREAGRAGGAAACRRLREIERRIGAEMVRDLEMLLIEQASAAGFAIRRGCPIEEAEPRGLTCLHRLAEAFDLVPAETA
ncbi:MAG: hypothetical protein ACK4MQ_04350 [Hyphomonas sp.]